MWDYPMAQGFGGSFLLTLLEVFVTLTIASIEAFNGGTLGQGGVLAELCATTSPTLAGWMGVLQDLGVYTCT